MSDDKQGTSDTKSVAHMKSREAISIFVDAVLNTREVKILRTVVQNSLDGKATTREEIADIFGKDYMKSSRAIDMYISRMRKKLTGLGIEMKTCYGSGYAVELNVAKYALTVIPDK